MFFILWFEIWLLDVFGSPLSRSITPWSSLVISRVFWAWDGHKNLPRIQPAKQLVFMCQGFWTVPIFGVFPCVSTTRHLAFLDSTLQFIRISWAQRGRHIGHWSFTVQHLAKSNSEQFAVFFFSGSSLKKVITCLKLVFLFDDFCGHLAIFFSGGLHIIFFLFASVRWTCFIFI